MKIKVRDIIEQKGIKGDYYYLRDILPIEDFVFPKWQCRSPIDCLAQHPELEVEILSME